jgi:DedD protein
MASGGKRRGAGERVLESKHVIGLFMLMLLFSGVFFTLGYVMGRNQFADGQVRASTNPRGSTDAVISPKKEPSPKTVAPASDANSGSSDPATQTAQPWEFYDGGKSKPEDDRLKPMPPPSSKTVPVRTTPVPVQKGNSSGSKSLNAPLIPKGSYMLQVAALTKQSDALDVATRLQKKKFPAFVLSAQADKYYRVQVGPFADQKAAEAARKGLEGAGFKAIVKH